MTCGSIRAPHFRSNHYLTNENTFGEAEFHCGLKQWGYRFSDVIDSGRPAGGSFDWTIDRHWPMAAGLTMSIGLALLGWCCHHTTTRFRPSISMVNQVASSRTDSNEFPSIRSDYNLVKKTFHGKEKRKKKILAHYFKKPKKVTGGSTWKFRKAKENPGKQPVKKIVNSPPPSGESQ